MMPRRNRLRCFVVAAVAVVCAATLSVCVINAVVLRTGKGRILSPEQAAALTDVDAILVLGAGVKADGTPSDMLHDRVLTATQLHLDGLDATLLMSGDNQHPDYDEVSAMVTLALSLGAAEDGIATDRRGLSTYESVVRGRELYGIERVVIVTQEYHLYRALYIAEHVGLEAFGVSADVRSYRGQAYREFREVAARCKDAVRVWLD